MFATPAVDPVEGTACGLIGLIGAACVLVVGERHCPGREVSSKHERISTLSAQNKRLGEATLLPMKADLRLLCRRGRKDFSPTAKARPC